MINQEAWALMLQPCCPFLRGQDIGHSIDSPAEQPEADGGWRVADGGQQPGYRRLEDNQHVGGVHFSLTGGRFQHAPSTPFIPHPASTHTPFAPIPTVLLHSRIPPGRHTLLLTVSFAVVPRLSRHSRSHRSFLRSAVRSLLRREAVLSSTAVQKPKRVAGIG